MKLIFELVVEDVNVTAELLKQKQLVKELSKEMIGIDAGADGFEELANKLAAARVQVLDLTKQQKELNREFKATQVPTDSLEGLRLEYSKLTEQIGRLSAAERETEAGKALIKNANAIKGEINDIQESVGNFTGNVGNYKGAILTASGSLAEFGGNIGLQTGVLQTAIGVFEAGSQASEKLSQSISSASQSFKENVQQFKEYLSSLRQTKKVNDDASESSEVLEGSIDGVGESGQIAGKGLEEGAKGASFFSRAANILKLVLNSLGIGLLISLVAGLISVFQRFAPVIDFVEQSVAGLSAAFDAFSSRVGQVFSGLGKIITGNFSEGFDQIGEAVSGAGAAMASAAIAASQLKKEMQDLEDAQKDFELTTAKTEASIAKLSVSLKDKTRSDSERLKIASQITQLERANLNEKTALIDKEIEIEKRKLLLSGQITQEQVDQIAAGNFEVARGLEDQFLLRADQADRIRQLLITRTKAEGESATLLERIESRRSAIIEAGAEKQKTAREKQKAAAEKAQKDLENQISRINELSKSIRDLDAGTITNDFDRQNIEIENRRAEALDKVAESRESLTQKIAQQKGVLSDADKKELALISEQTASIIASYDLQKETVEKNRQAAIDQQLNDLARLSLEVTNIAQENAVALARAESEIINTGFAKDQAELEAILNERKRALTAQLEEGTISQKRFKSEYIQAQEAFNIGSLQLERDRADAIEKINENLENARIDAAKAALAVRLQAIESETQAEIQAARDRATTQGGDAGAAISQLELRAIEQRASAQQQYNDQVREANDERVKSEIDAAEKINDANERLHEDNLERLDEEKEKRRELQQAALDAAGTIAGAIFEIERNRIEQQEEAQISALDTEFAKRREAAAGNAELLAKIDADYAKKKEAIEKEAARKRKQNAIVEAVIQGALAVVKSLPNLVLAALTAVATAAQIAVISSQNFAGGGIPMFKKSGIFGGRRHSMGGTKGVFDDGTQIEVERDEVFVILNRRASADINKLSAFNAMHGGRRFDTGGILDFTPQFGQTINGQSGGVFVVAEFTDEQIDILSGRIADRTGAATQTAVIAGLDDRNRTAERQISLEANREV